MLFNRAVLSHLGARSFGETLFMLRTQRSMSQRELARRARMSAGCLSEIENGRRPAPTRARVDSICAALNLAIADQISLQGVATAERLITVRVGSGVPRPVAELLRDIARFGPRLSQQDIVAIRAKLRGPAAM